MTTNNPSINLVIVVYEVESVDNLSDEIIYRGKFQAEVKI